MLKQGLRVRPGARGQNVVIERRQMLGDQHFQRKIVLDYKYGVDRRRHRYLLCLACKWQVHRECCTMACLARGLYRTSIPRDDGFANCKA